MTSFIYSTNEGVANAESLSWPSAVLNPISLITGVVMAILALFDIPSHLVFGGVIIGIKTIHLATFLLNKKLSCKTKSILIAIYLIKMLLATLALYRIISLENASIPLLALESVLILCVFPEGVSAPCIKCPPEEKPPAKKKKPQRT